MKDNYTKSVKNIKQLTSCVLCTYREPLDKTSYTPYTTCLMSGKRISPHLGSCDLFEYSDPGYSTHRYELTRYFYHVNEERLKDRFEKELDLIEHLIKEAEK